MSMAEPSAPAPNSGSDHLSPVGTETFAGALPPDPLLQSGCFIDPTTNSNGETRTNGAGKKIPDAADAAAPTPGRPPGRPVRGSAAPKPSSSGGASVTATPESAADGSEDSKPKRRRRVSAGERRSAAGETPDWLPAGWIVEDRVRASGATAGTIDKYYRDPVSGHVFRSKKEVLYFLENGIKRKKNADSSDADAETGEGSGSHKQKNSAALKAPPNFDFCNPPEKVTWVPNDSSSRSWTPFVDGKKVPDPTVREWSAAFNFVSTKRC